MLRLDDLPPGTPWLELACTRCDRRGRYSVPRLLAEHGPDETTYAIRNRARADCPRWIAEQAGQAQIYELCGAHWPEMARLMKAGQWDDRTLAERDAAVERMREEDRRRAARR